MCYLLFLIVLQVFRVLMDKLGHVEGFVVDFEAGELFVFVLNNIEFRFFNVHIFRQLRQII